MSLLTSLRSAAPVALIAALGLLLPTTTQARDDHGGFRGGSFHGGGRYFHGRFYPYGFGYPFLYPGFGYYGGGYYGSYYGPYGPSYGYDGRPYGYNAGAPGDLAVDVQRSLKRRGYYGGPVDGEIGAGSRNAIRNFQADHHLETTGRMDHDTLRALGI